MSTASRKLDHIRICLENEVESDWRPFDDLCFVHRALPEINASQIDTRCRFLGREIAAPMMISAMTGGHPDTKKINVNLALAAQEMGIGMGVGSQRAALENSQVEDTFSAVRDAAPDVPIIGNIGSVQLQKEGIEILDRLKEMIDADAIAVHLNFLQESIQPEGETCACCVIEALKSAAQSKVPIMVKETGAGICKEDAKRLIDAGVKMIDVGGLGGTSWSEVETYRAEERGDLKSAQIGRLFINWGVPTPVSVVECTSAGAEVISSGGIRNGIDVAKSLALGANVAGAALPFLKPAMKGADEVADVIRSYIKALRISMFLTASKDLSELKVVPVIIGGKTRKILELRGFNTKKFTIEREM